MTAPADHPGKRIVDVAVGTVLLIVALPVLVGLLALSAALYRTNPLFVHERIGRGGQTFRFAKVRTLPPSTGRYVDKFEVERLAVPRVMRFVRHVHLDEIPQLVHVVRGQMSLVGPRPEMPSLHHAMPAGFADERTRLRPGVTGLWQVSPACIGLIADAPEYDRTYVRHTSARLDAFVLWATLRKVIGRGTVALDDVPTWALTPEPGEAAEPVLVSLVD